MTKHYSIVALLALFPIATSHQSCEPELGTGTPDGGAGTTGSPSAPGSGPSGCAPLTVSRGVGVSGYTSDVFAYSDANCQPRTAALVRNDAGDPGGGYGGYLRRFTYQTGGKERSIVGTGANGWQGLGYVVSHYGNSAAHTRQTSGTYRTVLSGRHHAIHEYKWRLHMGGPVDVTVHWFFATGRSHPLYSITYDARSAGANALWADARSPYGDLAWDGTPGPVTGVGWGDKYRFRTTGTAPVTMGTGWDYRQPNLIPHALEWSDPANAELALVQAQSFDRQIGGADYGGGLLANECWNRTSATRGSGCSAAGEVMPLNWLWPFQLNQYELPFTNSSHRVAWGLNYGAVGQQGYQAFGRSVSGFPYQSYSVYIVLGEHQNSASDAQIANVTSAVRATLTATVGSVVTQASGGVGRTDLVSYAPAGYNSVYGVWDVNAASNRATVQLTPSGALPNPTLRVLGYGSSTPPAKVRVSGRELRADVDYFATVDTASKALWLTLNSTLSGATTIEVL